MKAGALITLLLLGTGSASAQESLAVVTEALEGQSYTLSIQILVLMTLLTLLPAVVLSMSAFVRVIIVLSILRQALGTAQTPPNQVLLGIALFLTFFVMTPVISDVNQNAVQPYIASELTANEAFDAALVPLREFMLNQTRDSDLGLFADIAGRSDIATPEDVPMSILIPSFMVSELKTAFQIGFLVFIPFLVIDLVVSSVLMSMGMMMLSPMLISLPFKIMLFVLVDGWALVLGTLASSFFL
ncbi:MAG: flagellar type III secretion system pore protein FliP [Woeseiaceae bacterium]|nr:flagellar type III secretion system pore protein FliP [Woeseiaceae bacterium]